jgi:hypothetical protein
MKRVLNKVSLIKIFISTWLYAFIQNLRMANIFEETRQIRAEIARLRSDVHALKLDLKQDLIGTRELFSDLIQFAHGSLSDQISRLESVLIPEAADRVLFYVLADGELKGISDMQMKVDAEKTIVAKTVDKFGNEASVEEGSAAWALTDPALGELTAAADGKSAKFVPAGKVGSLAVQFSADADLGEGVKTIQGELPVELLAGDAVAVELSAV